MKIIHYYLARNYLKYLLITLTTILFVLYIVAVMEILRKYSGSEASLLLLLKIALMKALDPLNTIIPFICILAGMFTLYRLNINSELQILQISGLSIIKILSIIMLAGFVMGLLYLYIINPFVATFLNNYANIENKMKQEVDIVSISKSGLWLRQVDRDAINIINISHISQNTSQLSDISIYKQSGSDITSYEAKAADVLPKKWVLYDVDVINADLKHYTLKEITLPFEMDISKIRNSLAQPNNISFLELGNFIEISKKSGIQVIQYEIYYISLFFIPVSMSIMSGFGAVFAFASARRNNLNKSLLTGIIAGFFVYCSSAFLQTFAIGKLFNPLAPVVLPIIVVFLITIYIAILFEEK